VGTAFDKLAAESKLRWLQKLSLDLSHPLDPVQGGLRPNMEQDQSVVSFAHIAGDIAGPGQFLNAGNDRTEVVVAGDHQFASSLLRPADHAAPWVQGL
jgi:hypothetical protein